MARAALWLVHFFVFYGFVVFFNPSIFSQIGVVSSSKEDFSILDFDFVLFGRDYLPPSPPQPPPSVSCEEDLHGIGSLNTSCQLNTDLQLEDDVYMEGTGNLVILLGVSVSCLVARCSITVNIFGDFNLGQNASIVTVTFVLKVSNARFQNGPSRIAQMSCVSFDMSSAVFIEPLPVIEFVAQLLSKAMLSRPLSDSNRVKIKKVLRGVKAEVTHRGNVQRKYRVSGLMSQPTRKLMFPLDDKSTMKSVVQYFHGMYGFTIHHTHLLCLQVGNQKKANYLPMEACKIVEGQWYTKRLNEKKITALLKVTCQRPKDRENDILQVLPLSKTFRQLRRKKKGLSR